MWIYKRGLRLIQPRYQRGIRMSAVKGIHKWGPETGLGRGCYIHKHNENQTGSQLLGGEVNINTEI